MTSTKCHIWLPFVLYIVGAVACTNQSTEPTNAIHLAGEYRIVSGERNGAAIDPHELDASITITEHLITAYDKERKETFAATYELDTERSPWRITMISTNAPETGVVAKGLVQAEHGQVKLVYALPEGNPPTEFKTGPQQQMFVLAKQETGLSG